jgi:hypothetical protein
VEIEAMPGGPRVDVYDEDVSLPPPAPPPPVPSQRADPDRRPAPEPWRPPLPTPAAGAGAGAAGPGGSGGLFFTREPSRSAAGPGSAYVTAHLAALARAEGPKIGRREPPPERRREPPWSPDFRELVPQAAPEPFPPAANWAAEPRPAVAEQRVVAPGSHARAGERVAKRLQRYGISEGLARELIASAGAHALALAPRAGLVEAVRTTLAQRIPVAPALPSKGAAIVLVGAGGAGKTTSCAALLGAYRKSSSLPASCATITRAHERGELQMILSPHIMTPTPASAPRALRALRRDRGEGLVVLDTPHLSPSDRAGIRELASLLAELEPERVVVALPATLGATAAAQLLQALRPLGANALAVTHADETDQIGVAVEAACRFGLAPEYMLERGRSGGWRLRQLDPTGLAAKLLQ